MFVVCDGDEKTTSFWLEGAESESGDSAQSVNCPGRVDKAW